MSGDRITDLGEFAGRRIPRLIEEACEQINEAAVAVVETAEADEKDAVLNIPVAIKWHLDTGKVEITLAVNLRRKWESCGELPDRNQPKLPGLEDDPEDAVVLPNPQRLANIYRWTHAAEMSPAKAFDWLNEVCEEKGLPRLADIEEPEDIETLERAVVVLLKISVDLVRQMREAPDAEKAASGTTVTIEGNGRSVTLTADQLAKAASSAAGKQGKRKAKV